MTTLRASARLYPLAAGSAAVGTSSYSVASLLPAISRRLAISPLVGGQLVTAFAVACAVSSFAVALIAQARAWDRRRIVVSALLITGVGNACTALAPAIVPMFGARIVTAVGVAVYVPAATTLAAAVSSPGRRARAMAVVLSGLTAALLLGVPATSALLEFISGDQGVFWLITASCLVAACVIHTVVPGRADTAPLPAMDHGVAVRARRTLVLVMTLLATIATFMIYTYITMVLAKPTAYGAPVTMLLATYGLGAVAGNALAGRAADRWHPARVLVIATASSAVALLLLAWAVAIPAPMTVAVVLMVWGGACWSIYTPANAWLSAPILVSLNTSGVYLGMATGSLLGGVVVDWAGVNVLIMTAALAAGAACVLVIAARPHRTSSP